MRSVQVPWWLRFKSEAEKYAREAVHAPFVQFARPQDFLEYAAIDTSYMPYVALCFAYEMNAASLAAILHTLSSNRDYRIGALSILKYVGSMPDLKAIASALPMLQHLYINIVQLDDGTVTSLADYENYAKSMRKALSAFDGSSVGYARISFAGVRWLAKKLFASKNTMYVPSGYVQRRWADATSVKKMLGTGIRKSTVQNYIEDPAAVLGFWCYRRRPYDYARLMCASLTPVALLRILQYPVQNGKQPDVFTLAHMRVLRCVEYQRAEQQYPGLDNERLAFEYAVWTRIINRRAKKSMTVPVAFPTAKLFMPEKLSQQTKYKKLKVVLRNGRAYSVRNQRCLHALKLAGKLTPDSRLDVGYRTFSWLMRVYRTRNFRFDSLSTLLTMAQKLTAANLPIPAAMMDKLREIADS